MSKDNEALFVETYNNLEKFPSIADVAEKLGIAIRTVHSKAQAIRSAAKDDPKALKLIARSPKGELPMSEDPSRFKPEYTAQDCLDELRRVAELDPEQVVTRNYFRNHSRISEATWNCHYGTFEEFKRQAGIKLSRSQHAMERAIAKHASVDHYRLLSERADYGDKYVRENPRRFKTIVVCSDLHDIEIDPFFLRVLLDTIKRVRPDGTVFGGDVFDLAEFGKYGVDPREWDVTGRIKFVHDNIFAPIRLIDPDMQMDFIEGNHEARLLRHLADATPALRAVLSELHGFTVGKLLGLDQFEINYIAKADLAAWTVRDFNKEIATNNYKTYWDSLLVHHMPYARNMGMPGINGHHHAHQVWSMFNPVYGAYEWHQIGAGHKRSASYTEGEKWHNGFAIVNIDTYTKATNFDYVPVTDFAVSGGKWYHRTEEEGTGFRGRKLIH